MLGKMADEIQVESTCASAAKALDPRIVRTRRMLMDALYRLLNRKEFDDISVQEIADEATLNRATFYLHYPDKNALLHAMTADRFRELISRRNLSFSDCDHALEAIVLGVCDFLADRTACPKMLVKMPMERSVVPVVEELFNEGTNRHPLAPGVDAGLMATTVAWAIYGAAWRWSQTPGRKPAEEMAQQIAAMVKPVILSAAG
jgi:AcrR family transcriptional regulator